MDNLSNFKIVIDQIKKTFPGIIIHYGGNGTFIDTVELKLLPFGSISMNSNYDIFVQYLNPFDIEFEYFKLFFETRLKFDNASVYFYENRITIFQRIGKDIFRKTFENSMIRANNFVLTANEIKNFLDYNQKLTQ